MFFDINVMNSETLGAAWRLGNQVSVDTSNVGLTKMSSSVNKSIKSGRVSLRTCSVLVNGAARMYKENADLLFTDCIKLNKEMIRGRNKPQIEIDTSSNSTEEDSRKIQRNSKSQGKYSNRKRSNPDPIQRSRSKRSGTNSLENDLLHTNKTNSSISSSSTTKEKGVQTTKSFISDRSAKYFPNNSNIDKALPFALVLVFDAGSQIPRKIIYSNINPERL